MTLARQIAAEIREAEAHGHYCYLFQVSTCSLIRIVRARTRNGRTEVRALGSGEWLECPSFAYIRVR